MTTAVATAAGASSALAIGRSGYVVCWAEIRYPHEAGYQVCWVEVRLPYIIASLTLIQGGGGSSDKARSKRRIVNDDLDLQDLAELWGMFRKAA